MVSGVPCSLRFRWRSIGGDLAFGGLALVPRWLFWAVRSRHILLGLAFFLALMPDLLARSRRPPPDRNQAQSAQQPAATDQRGTDETPFIVKVLPSEDAKAKAEQEAADRAAKDQLDTNTFRLGIATIIVAFLQFVAIGVQAIFLWLAFKATKKSADIAEASLVKLERAFVFPTDFHVRWHWHTDFGATILLLEN